MTKLKKLSVALCCLGFVILAAACSSLGTDHSAQDTAATDQESGGNVIISPFTTEDIEGNQVTDDILAEAPLTLINVWATYCGICIDKMPELGAAAEEYQGRVQFMGIVSDTLNSDGSVNQATVDTAVEIVAETGADYLHILPSKDLVGLLSQISAVPTTLFVDSEGRQVGAAYTGGLTLDQLRDLIDQALAEVEQ